MAKPNYNHQKKQKELARQARQKEKLQKRQARGVAATDPEPGSAPPAASTPDAG